MPLFEFKCNDCGHEFEELVVPSSDKILCPQCGSENLDKLFSAFASNSTKSGQVGGRSAKSGSGFG